MKTYKPDIEKRWATVDEIQFVKNLEKNNEGLIEKHKLSGFPWTERKDFLNGYIKGLSLRIEWGDINEYKLRKFLTKRGE